MCINKYRQYTVHLYIAGAESSVRKNKKDRDKKKRVLGRDFVGVLS